MEFWFRRKYQLPPHDPRFLDMSPDEIEVEYWAYRSVDSPHEEEMEDDEFDIEKLTQEEDWEDVISAKN